MRSTQSLWSMTSTSGYLLWDSVLLILFLIFFLPLLLCRGISSTVRRCIEKETGREFAAKIIDLGADSGDASSSQMLEATRQEIAILRQVMGHPYISEYFIVGRFVRSYHIHFLTRIFDRFFFLLLRIKISRTARRIRIGCIHIFGVWIVPQWRIIRLLDIGGDAVGEKDQIYYATGVRRRRLHTFKRDCT